MHVLFPKRAQKCSCKTFLSSYLALLFERACCLYVPLHFTMRQWGPEVAFSRKTVISIIHEGIYIYTYQLYIFLWIKKNYMYIILRSILNLICINRGLKICLVLAGKGGIGLYIYSVNEACLLLAERHCIQTITSAPQNKPGTAFSAFKYLVSDCYMNLSLQPYKSSFSCSWQPLPD